MKEKRRPIKKRWRLLIWVTLLFMLLTCAISLGQEPSLNVVLVDINHSPIYSTDADSLGNVPLKYNHSWCIGMINWEDDTHEPVANPKVTLRSNLKFLWFYPSDPRILTLQPATGIYTWDLNGGSLYEYENLCCNFEEAGEVPIKKPGFTVSRTVFPEILENRITLQRVAVIFKLEEPLPPGTFVSVRIGEFRIPYERDLLVRMRVLEKTAPEGWWNDPYPFYARWETDAASLQVGRSYTFRATIESTKSNELLGAPVFKPEVYVVSSSNEGKGEEVSTSTTIMYSDAISATFTADNVVLWRRQIINQYAVKLNRVFSEVTGENPPYHVKIHADVTINPNVVDLADKGVLTALISLPKGYDIGDIVVSTLRCRGVPAVRGMVSGEDTDVYEAEFNTQDLPGAPIGDTVTLTITGELTDGTRFEGSTTVKIVDSQPARERVERLESLIQECRGLGMDLEYEESSLSDAREYFDRGEYQRSTDICNAAITSLEKKESDFLEAKTRAENRMKNAEICVCLASILIGIFAIYVILRRRHQITP